MIRKGRAWEIDASSTSAAPVGIAGSVRIRSNALATGLEASFDGAAYVPFGGSSTLAWSALAAPTADLTLNHGNWKTQFDFTAADAAENCFLIQSAADAAGTGPVLYVRTQGTTSTKIPFKVDANGAAAFVIDAGGSGTFSKDLFVPDGETFLSRTSAELTEHPLVVAGTLNSDGLSGSYYNSRFLFTDIHTNPGLTETVALRITYNRYDPGTWPSAVGVMSDMLVTGTVGTTTCYFKSYSAGIEVPTGSTVTTWAAYYAPVSGSLGDITNQYGFIAEAGLNSGFGTTAPTATLHVSGSAKFDLGGTPALGDMYYRGSTGSGGLINTLPIGLTGYVLKSAGSGIGPAWGTLDGTDIVTGIVALARGGTGASLADPNADAILFWDDSAGAVAFLTPGSGLSITGTTITATGTMTVPGSGTELMSRLNATTLQEVVGSSVSGGNVTIAGTLKADGGNTGYILQNVGSTNTQFYCSQFGGVGTQSEWHFQKASGTQGSPGNCDPTADGIATIFFEARNAGSYTTVGQIIAAQASSGNVVQLSVGSNLFALYSNSCQLNIGSDATGDTYYRNSSGRLVRLPVSTNGFVLTLAAGVPTWAAGGGMTVAGSGTELQYRSSGTALAALTSSSVSGADLTLGGQFKTDAVAKGFGLYDISQTNLAQYWSQFGSISVQHEVYFRKASGTQGSPGNCDPTIADALGTIIWQARTGGSYVTVAQISAAVASSGNILDISCGSTVGISLYASGGASGIEINTIVGDATGDIYYRNSSGRFTRLGIGTATHVLTVTGGLPVWAAAAGGMTVPGSGTELQYRSSGTALAALTSSSVSGANLSLGGDLTVTGTVSVGGSLPSGIDGSFRANSRYDFLIRGYTTIANRGAVLRLEKSNGTIGSEANVDAGTFVGDLQFNAWQSSATRTIAEITTQTGSAFGSSNYHGRMALSVTKAGDATPIEHLILMDGTVTVVGTSALGLVNAATNVITNLHTYDYQSSGTPAVGFGGRVSHKLESSTTASRDAVLTDWRWQNATDANRSAVYSIKTFSGAEAAASLTTPKERQLIGGYKALSDSTRTDLFTITYASGDQKAVGGHVSYTIMARQVSGGNQIQITTDSIPFACFNNGTSNSGEAIWGSSALQADVESTGSAMGITMEINGLTGTISSANVFTFQITVNSDLSSFAEFWIMYDIFYRGSGPDITLA